MVKRIVIGAVTVRLFGGSMATGMKTWKGYLYGVVICTAFYRRTLNDMAVTLIGDTANISNRELRDLSDCMNIIAAQCSEDPRAMAKAETSVERFEIDLI